MARPKSEIPAPTEHAPTPDTQLTVIEDLAAQKHLSEHGNMALLVAKMTNLPMVPHLLKIELGKATELNNFSNVYAGSIMLAMQKCMAKSDFLDAITDFGYTFGYAQRLQAMYLRFGTKKEFMALGSAKMTALLPLEDELIEQIEAGEIPNLKPSDMLRLTTKELIKELLELRDENRASKARLIEARAEKDAALDKLETRDKALADNQTKVGAYLGMLQTADMQLISAIRHRGKVNNLLSEALEETKIKLTAAQDESRIGNLSEIQRLLDDAEISVIPIRSGESAFGALV